MNNYSPRIKLFHPWYHAIGKSEPYIGDKVHVVSISRPIDQADEYESPCNNIGPHRVSFFFHGFPMPPLS